MHGFFRESHADPERIELFLEKLKENIDISEEFIKELRRADPYKDDSGSIKYAVFEIISTLKEMYGNKDYDLINNLRNVTAVFGRCSDGGC